MKFLVSRLRTLLVLGRVSNLPTVWSNLLTGLFLAGANIFSGGLVPLFVGASLLYIGGMYLNDFCDASFDARYCPERPIPSKKISRWAVGTLATTWLIVGFALLVPYGSFTIGIALLQVALIVLYDFWHKNNPASPILMGICRLLLYLLAGSVIEQVMSWHVALWGLASGLYVAGITYLARGESRPGKPARWALVFLLFPVVVAGWFALYYSIYVILLFCLLLPGWMAWLLIPLWRGTNRSIGRVVSGLLAGIILADATILAPVLVAPINFGIPVWGLTYLALFLAALLLQRIIPAT